MTALALQPHLLAPERGIRNAITESISSAYQPVRNAVFDASRLLRGAMDSAMRIAAASSQHLYGDALAPPKAIVEAVRECGDNFHLNRQYLSPT